MWWSSFFPRYFRGLITSSRPWSLSSLLESPGRLPKLSKSLPDWHSSGPRRITLSDHCLWTFPCTTIHHGAFPNICSSSDAFLLVNTVKTQYKSSSLCPHSYYGFWVYLWCAFVLESISSSLVCVCFCFFKKKKKKTKASLYLVWIFFFFFLRRSMENF